MAHSLVYKSTARSVLGQADWGYTTNIRPGETKADLHELKASLGLILSSKPAKATQTSQQTKILGYLKDYV